MRDNFSNPNPFLNQAKQYQELVNQPTPSDRWADSLKQLGSQPANSRGQRSYNAVMQGFASGVQGSQDKKRQEKLSPILEKAGQITAKAAELEAQAQQERQRVFTGTKFVRDNITRLSALGEGSMAQDSVGTQGVARELGRNYQKAFGLNLGEFDYYDVNSRRIFYAKDDVVTGYSIPDILREYATEAFGEQAPYVMRNLDPYSKNTWEYTQLMQQAELAQKNSTANVNNAHAGNFNAQTEKTQHEMNAPAKLSPMEEFTLKANRETSEKYLEKLGDEITKKDPSTKIIVLNRLKELFESEADFGGTPKDAFFRYIKKTFGADEKIQEAKMLQKYFFPDIKGVAGNPNGKEWDDLVTRIISGEENLESAFNMIELEKTQAQNMLDQYDDYANVLAETNYSIPHHHPDITSKVKNRRSSMSKPAQNGKDKNVDQLKKQYFIK